MSLFGLRGGIKLDSKRSLIFNLIDEADKIVFLQRTGERIMIVRSIQKVVTQEQTEEEKCSLSPDILRLLGILARIEIRRQARQRLADREKAS